MLFANLTFCLFRCYWYPYSDFSPRSCYLRSWSPQQHNATWNSSWKKWRTFTAWMSNRRQPQLVTSFAIVALLTIIHFFYWHAAHYNPNNSFELLITSEDTTTGTEDNAGKRSSRRSSTSSFKGTSRSQRTLWWFWLFVDFCLLLIIFHSLI